MNIGSPRLAPSGSIPGEGCRFPYEVTVDDRSQYVGASEVAALLPAEDGRSVLSPYLTPRLLYGQKRGEVSPVEPSMQMDIGNALEAVIVARARRDGLLPAGVEAGPPISAPALRRGYLGAHPDLIADGPIDVKVVFRTSAAWDDAVPEHYVAQLAAQLACLGARGGRAAILSLHLDRGAEIRIAWLDVPPGWVDAVEESAEAFFEGYVLPGRLPPAFKCSARGVAYPLDSAAQVRLATAREQEILAEIAALRPAAERIEELRAEIAEHLADTPAIVGADGRRLATFKPERRSVLDRSAIPADVLSAATTTTEARVLRLARSKE